LVRQAALFGDQEALREIVRTNDVKKIKALGRQVRGFVAKARRCVQQ
jgi:hypothetical protein